MLCWRGLRPMRVLALAELILASLAITQNSGVQVYPDWWGALGVLALTGLFLHAVNGSPRDRAVPPRRAGARPLIPPRRPPNGLFPLRPGTPPAPGAPRCAQPKVLVRRGGG